MLAAAALVVHPLAGSFRHFGSRARLQLACDVINGAAALRIETLRESDQVGLWHGQRPTGPPRGLEAADILPCTYVLVRPNVHVTCAKVSVPK